LPTWFKANQRLLDGHDRLELKLEGDWSVWRKPGRKLLTYELKVEYYDPSSTFPAIASSLLARLPLRNLHWKSPNRPTRSINSLHVDLVAHDQSHLEDDIGLHRTDTNDSSTSDSNSNRRSHRHSNVEQKTIPDAGKGTFKGPLKERRHQIPGLRQTPYLKLYLLRCDDNETYKNSSRKLLREWIKQVNPQSPLAGLDNHDSSEWLIVHVVSLGTAAAAQPRYSGSNDTAVPDKGGASRWPGRGSSTLLEKVRADFNGSSKTTKDRVCQIRIPKKSDRPGSNSGESKEQESDWLDLIAKMKSLILTSFDLRVRQYEEDIREKEIQRTLPGWNFCTFFVLKEGLARGFESVGLVEDARIGYDELSVGLDTVIREQMVSNESQAGAFLPYTEDMRRLLEHHLQSFRDRSTDERDSTLEEVDQPPISANRKKYRELILANNISIYDFRCYIFARQLSLLLRLANSQSSRSEFLGSVDVDRQLTDVESENMLVLAEICRRGLEFVSSVSRTLKADLLKGYASAHPEMASDWSQASSEYNAIIENMIFSWSYSACQQILSETSTKSLPIPWSSEANLDFMLQEASIDGQEPKASLSEPKTILHPARTSSLQDASESQRFDERTRAPSTGTSQAFLKTGLERLAALRAELYLLLRSNLQHTSIFQHWLSKHNQAESLKETSLNEDTVNKKILSCGILDPQLRSALETEANLLNLYEVRHCSTFDRMLRTSRSYRRRH
jgi:hypothetical protein